ncbi:unnamed protein product [Gordionus sp. m RMFG-2023]|uniref:uncharacterized protein LOC135931077 n=1 Tax=Gordionus sp. m RMFG-2023 TaxID=3053472 RepID=UPI0030E1605E
MFDNDQKILNKSEYIYENNTLTDNLEVLSSRLLLTQILIGISSLGVLWILSVIIYLFFKLKLYQYNQNNYKICKNSLRISLEPLQKKTNNGNKKSLLPLNYERGPQSKKKNSLVTLSTNSKQQLYNNGKFKTIDSTSATATFAYSPESPLSHSASVNSNNSSSAQFADSYKRYKRQQRNRMRRDLATVIATTLHRKSVADFLRDTLIPTESLTQPPLPAMAANKLSPIIDDYTIIANQLTSTFTDHAAIAADQLQHALIGDTFKTTSKTTTKTGYSSIDFPMLLPVGVVVFEKRTAL